MTLGSSSFETVSVEDDGEGVAVLWLDRPVRGNAFTFAMQGELHQALAELDAAEDVRVIVVTGRGRFFSTGADMEAGGSSFAQSEEQTAALRRIMATRPRPWSLRTPVIGALNGAAVGLGLTLPLQWDIRVMAEEAKYGFVFTRRGLTPEAGSAWLLPRLVGLSRATELLLTGRFFNGAEAVAMGLASTAVPAGDVLTTALAMAHDLSVSCSPLALAATKQLLQDLPELDDVELAWSTDWELFRWVGRQDDASEGVQAFLGKRAPVWTGSKHATLPGAPTNAWELPR